MTVTHECENLDAFLGDELGAVASARFEAHLRKCPACREAIDEQRWIDALLRASARLQVDSAPPAILESLRASVCRRRQARQAACGLAAATLLVIAAGWTTLLNRDSISTVVQEAGDIPIARDATLPKPRATFVGGSDMIVVPVESRLPDVTIVRIYRTYQPSYTAQVRVDQTTDQFAWPDDPTEVSDELPKFN